MTFVFPWLDEHEPMVQKEPTFQNTQLFSEKAWAEPSLWSSRTKRNVPFLGRPVGPAYPKQCPFRYSC